jgi:hypothetical protein
LTVEAATLALIVSGCALAVSLLTLWLTLLRRGSLRMTQPTQFFLGPDGSERTGSQKIFLRTLLYSTSKRGHVIENMYVHVSHGETKITYPIWVFGDQHLSRGSGLLVSEQGVVANHHFLRPADSIDQPLTAGEYTISIFTKLVGEATPRHLNTTTISISESHASALASPRAGIYFDWGPESQRYIAHVPIKAPEQMPRELMDILKNLRQPDDVVIEKDL